MLIISHLRLCVVVLIVGHSATKMICCLGCRSSIQMCSIPRQVIYHTGGHKGWDSKAMQNRVQRLGGFLGSNHGKTVWPDIKLDSCVNIKWWCNVWHLMLYIFKLCEALANIPRIIIILVSKEYLSDILGSFVEICFLFFDIEFILKMILNQIISNN